MLKVQYYQIFLEFSFCDCFRSSVGRQMVLCLEKILQLIPYIRIGVSTILCGQIRGQMIRIMTDLTDVVLIGIIVRIRDYLNSLEWDGTERIHYALSRYLGADENEYTYECLRLFMLGAISRVFKPGCKFEVMLCLVGGQGAGKSSFFRLLAVKDEWFSDDLKKIDDDNVYRKMQGHWIIEMSEMIATANARSIEEIKSFISRPKETYKVPYETHPADRLRQCVFGGSSNTMDFLPLDRSGNRRFLPIMVHPERAEVHILEDEAASRAFIDMMWAEAMFIYRNFPVKLTLSKDMDKELKELQRQFMPEDTKAGLIQSFLDNFDGTQRP